MARDALTRVDLDGQTHQQAAAMDRLAGDLHAGFDLGGGPLLKAVLFDLGADARPVLLVAPDTARTNTVTSAQLSVYNAGSGTLSWNLASTDTAFTRCGAQCSFAPSSGSVAAG